MTKNMNKTMFMPMPSNLNYWWNFGSLLGLILMTQLVTGIFISMFYENSTMGAFDSINQICRNINMGWLIRSIHANGASVFFIFIYMHIGRNIYFNSYKIKYAWWSGCLLLLLLFMTAFIGYVLPWGQMSFWGATVITNLLSSIPYIGDMMTQWLWGGFSVNKSTLQRFFSLHFLLPFIMMGAVLLHIIFLHSGGSSNPLGINSNMDKIPFLPYYSTKDLMGIMMTMLLFCTLFLIFPFMFMDPDNFNIANPMVTPPHIQPEWYYLFAYAILRSIPNKLGGVIALLMSIIVLTFLPMIKSYKKNSLESKTMYNFMFFMWMSNFMYLTLLGSLPIEDPFVNLSQACSTAYFMYFIFLI